MDKIWQAKWITDQKFANLIPRNVFHKELDTSHEVEHRDDLKNHHMLVRKKFHLTSEIDHAFLDITADDYYKVYLNGKFVVQ